MNRIVLLLLCLFTHASYAIAYEELEPMEGYKQVHANSKTDELLFPVSKYDFQTLKGSYVFLQYRHDENSEVIPHTNQDIMKYYLDIVREHEGTGVYKDKVFASYRAVFNGDKVCLIVEVYEGGTAYSVTYMKVGKAAELSINADNLMASLNNAGRVALYFNFESGKANLDDASQRDVFQVVKMLKKFPDLRIKVEGHTDNIGNDEANTKLSEQRANAIKAYMVHSGIHHSRIVAEGFGASKPIESNDTEAGRDKNRRVELVKLE